MKYTMKITASLMAAAMSLSVLGTASAGAVNFTVVDGSNISNTTNDTTVTPSSSSSTVQNAIPEFYNGCVKFTWTAVPNAASYAVKICTTDGKVVKTYSVSKKYTAVVVPETVFNVDYNSKKDFYACVIAIKPGETDSGATTFYAPSASKFTVKSDMSEYPEFGSAHNVTFSVKNGKLLINWTNPNDFSDTKDIFSVSVEDRYGKSVYSTSVTTCSVEASGLKDGQEYTVKIYNNTFSAMTIEKYTFKSDTVKQPSDSSSSNKTDSDSVLEAPKSINAKAGDKKATISWSNVENADGYRIYIYDASSKKYKTYKTVKGTKCTVKNLTNGTKYKFKVAAVRYNKSTKKYVAGKASATVTVAPKAAGKTTSSSVKTAG